ncbi:MAG: hypothetical protein ACREM8_01310 [Vulcanimicrobiaceae bacterium]
MLVATTPRHSAVATLLFLAFTTLFGIAAHLFAELAGLGWRDDATVLFSARHAYLAVLATAIFGSLFATLAAIPHPERRVRIASWIDALPFRGDGVRFTAIAFVAQFAFFFLTQLGEGSPLRSGDVLAGVVAAAIASALGATLVTFGKRRMIEFAFAFVRYLTIRRFARASGTSRSLRKPRVAVPPTRRRTPFAFRYRPPPVIAASV